MRCDNGSKSNAISAQIFKPLQARLPDLETMNQQQSQTVIGQAQQIETFDFDTIIKRVYPDRTDLENIVISQISLQEFLQLSKRVLNQFLEELQDRDKYIILPFTFSNAQLGQATLDGQIQGYFANLNGDNLPASENILFWLISYQIENGFYNKATKRQSEQTSNNVNKLAEKLGLLEINIENKLKEVQTIYAELDINKKEIQNLINQKKDELASITNSLSTSTTQANQINDLLTKGTEQSARLSSITEQQDITKTKFDAKLVDLEALYNKTSTDLSSNIKTVLGQIDEFKLQVQENEGHLKFVESKRTFFEERINYLQDLIGQEVGANLFKTFKFRKDELEKPLIFWRWAVPAMAIATIAWIFFLFYHQPDITDINLWWQAFAVNTLKSIPAIFLLFFAINQYGKERNFQEEYAFKSAVALTIDAYAGRLTDVVNKDKLIMEAVLGIYRTPIEARQSGGDKIKPLTALETIRSMADTTKELVKNAK